MLAVQNITAAQWGAAAQDALALSVASCLPGVVVDAASSVAITSVQDTPPAGGGVLVHFTVQAASAAAAASVGAWTAAVAKLAPFVYTEEASVVGGGVLAAVISPPRSAADHSFEAALTRLFANGTAALADNGARGGSDPLSVAATGAALVLDYTFALEGSPSASEADINGLVLHNLARDIAGGVAVRLRGARYTIHASSTPLQPGFSDHHFRRAPRRACACLRCCLAHACAAPFMHCFALRRACVLLPPPFTPCCDNRHLFNLGGFAAVLHGNRVWVGNSNGASANCAEGYDISGGGTNGTTITGPVWGVGTARDLEFVLDAAGTVASFTIDGAPALIAASSPAQQYVPQGCAPLLVQAGTHLFFGASGNEQFNDSASPLPLPRHMRDACVRRRRASDALRGFALAAARRFLRHRLRREHREDKRRLQQHRGSVNATPSMYGMCNKDATS
jgi:hypothetical protein